MFYNPFIEYHKQQQRKSRAKIFFFSFISSLLAAVTAFILGNKEAREKINEKSQKVQKNLREKSSQLMRYASGKTAQLKQELEKKYTTPKKNSKKSLKKQPQETPKDKENTDK